MLFNERRRLYNYLYRIFFKKIHGTEPESYLFLPKNQLTYSADHLYTLHNADFINQPKFKEVYAEVKEIGGPLLEDYDIQWRIHVICWFANFVKNLEGDFVDCGVNTGFCPMAVIKYTDFERLDKKYYFFDTFYGLDPQYSNDYEMERHKNLGYGQNENLFEEVRQRFEPYNVEIVKGPVPKTLSDVKIEKVAYLSLDMNSVLPEVEALKFFWDKMVSGGVIILDDYGYPGCIEQKEAHDEFAKSKGVEVLSLPTCQGIILKP